MEVYFDQAATETDIQQLITAFNLEVVMSWFEPPDDSGEGMNSASGGGGEPDRGASRLGKADGFGGAGVPAGHPSGGAALRGGALPSSGTEVGATDSAGVPLATSATGEGGRPWPPSEARRDAHPPSVEAGKTASGGVLGLGNEIAWFDLEYDQQMLPTVEAAYQFFKGLPHLESCLPHITDYAVPHYAKPNDRIYDNWLPGDDPDDPPHEEFEWFPDEQAPRDMHRQSRWIDAFDIPAYPADVPLQPYSGRKQYIAVMDDGVYRAHPDMGRLSALGVECYDRSYSITQNGGNPVYEVTKPGMESNPYWGRLNGHGTQIASLINGATNNWIGTPSLAPGATILPIRLKQWTKYWGLPGVPYEPTWSVNAHVKAVRALRFQFYHGSYDFYVRVVNMSFGYPSYVWNLPWPPNFPTGEFKTNLGRDLKKNDRLYIASAGNEAVQGRFYPAAHELVLGVTGVDWNYLTEALAYDWSKGPDQRSNYMYDETYPVSGVFWIEPWIPSYRYGSSEWAMLGDPDNLDAGFTAITPPLAAYMSSTPRWHRNYKHCGGTSAAAPQIAALAYHLYSHYPELGQKTYAQVRQRIIGSRGSSVGPCKGVANYHAAISGW